MSAKSRRTNKRFFIGTVLVIAAMIFLGVRANQATANGPLKGFSAIVYRSATCGCCQQYIAYLKRNGLKIEEKIAGNDDSDLTAIKDQFNVPKDIRSCHTTRIGNYTIEGHVPVEAIQKLLTEKPAVAGISLPGMPSGSPGMPGVKYGTFDVQSFTASGSTSLFMQI